MIIGVSGKARSGKDELAHIAVQEFGAAQTYFAMALKREVADFLMNYGVEWDERHLFGTQEDKEANLVLWGVAAVVADIPEFADFVDKYGDTTWFGDALIFNARSLLQWWGTDYRRSQDNNYWINKTLAEVCTDPDKVYVISDCRFRNEAAALRAVGGYLIRVERPNRPIPSNPQHPSETDLDGWGRWDCIIDNLSTLEEYQEKCRCVLTHILRGASACSD